MSMEIIYDDVFEAMIRRAVIDNLDAEIDAMEDEIRREGPFPFSKRHERRMKRLFARTRRKDTFKPALKWSKRVAAVVLIFVALLFGSLMLVPDVRAVVVDTIVEWYDKFTQFVFRSDDTVDADAHWEITDLPEGYEMVYNSYEADVSCTYFSNSNTGDTIFFDYRKGKSSISINNEGLEYSKITQDGFTYYLFIANNTDVISKTIWERDGYRFSLSTLLDKEAILDLARSVQKKK